MIPGSTARERGRGTRKRAELMHGLSHQGAREPRPLSASSCPHWLRVLLEAGRPLLTSLSAARASPPVETWGDVGVCGNVGK